jgi:hypothetical protein
MWTFVCQLQTAAVRQGWTNVSTSCTSGLHNKFTELYKLHKNFKKFFIFLVILRIDFFEIL